MVGCGRWWSLPGPGGYLFIIIIYHLYNVFAVEESTDRDKETKRLRKQVLRGAIGARESFLSYRTDIHTYIHKDGQKN